MNNKEGRKMLKDVKDMLRKSAAGLKVTRRAFSLGLTATAGTLLTANTANALQFNGFSAETGAAHTLFPVAKPQELQAFSPSAPHIQRADVIAAATGRLRVHNQNTGENIDIVYREEDQYLDQSLQEINHFFRDHRNNKQAQFSPYLLDYLDSVTHKIGYSDPVTVICAYRSPETNSMLRARGNRAVAKHSYHTRGAALDVRLKETHASYARKAAVGLKAGGVGYYPRANFVHLDAGPYRQWVG
jgi:uncharacterized protein YcbK (DUF882 family)